MSLAARFESGPTTTKKGPTCTVGALLAALPLEESAALEAMLGDQAWQGSTISQAIGDELGARVSGVTVQRHRRGLCMCGVGA